MNKFLFLFLYMACCCLSGQLLFAQYSTTTTYQYDNLNRVVSITQGGGTVVTYTYDQVGNRTIGTTAGAAAPDLVLQNLSVSPISVVAGGSVTATLAAANIGNASAIAGTVKYYWSANNTFEATTDVLLGSSAVGALAASGTQALSQVLTVPVGTAAGSSYIIAVADANNTVSESNEGNNTAAVAITVATTTPVFSCSGAIGLSNGVAVTGSNATGSNAITDYPCVAWNESGREVVYMYNHSGGNLTVALSNMTVDLDWFALSTCDTTNCLAYGDNSNTFAAPAGTYYIVVDGYQGASGSYTLTASSGYPNLVMQTPAVLPATGITAGGSLSVSATLANVGSFAAVAGSVRCYISANTTYEATDVLLNTFNSSVLAANGSQAISNLVNIPSSIAAGTWYILFRADATNTNTESNETDNLASVALSVTSGTIDLTPLTFTLSANSIAKGSYFSTNTNIKNNGTGTTGASKFNVYFSTDNVLSTATDILLFTGDNAAIAAGATDNRIYYHTVPTSVTAGTWYVIVVADATSLVTESNETNNTMSLQVTITVPTINCTPATVLSNGVAVTGSNATGSNTITGYSCIPIWGEGGNEVFYTYNHTGGTLTATLSGMTTDQDVFILSSCSPASCVLYGDVTATGTLAAGTYTIVVDGYQGALGNYTLLVSSGSVCTAPSISVSATTSSSVTLAWSTVSGATSYSVEWSINGGAWSTQPKFCMWSPTL